MTTDKTNPFARVAARRQQAQSQQFNVKTELADLVESVVSFSAEAIMDQVSAIEETRTLFALADAVDLESQGVDLTITCAKSGGIIHSFTIHDYLSLKEIHGEERAVEILQSRQFSAIAPAWLFTDNKALDALQIADPYGYCVYAASRLLLPGLMHYRKLEDMPFAVRSDWHRQKAEANKLARYIPLPKLVELNEMLRRFLAIVMPGKAKLDFSYNRLDEALATGAWSIFLQEIKENLTSLITREMKRGRISPYISYGDCVKLSDIYQGYGNFRAQRKPKEKTETDVIADIINDAFADQQIPRYMTGHEPKFKAGAAKKREQVFTPKDTQAAFDAALADLDLQTSGDKPLSGKPSFLQLIAMRKKG